MNIKDLPQGSFKVISNPTNINQLPTGSFKVVSETQPKKETDFVNKLGSFFGVKNIGKKVAGVLAPIYAKITGESEDVVNATKEVAKLDDPKLKQVLGDLLQVGATVATGGVGGGLLKTATKVAGLGAAAGFGAGLAEDKSILDSAKQAITTGIASAGTYGALVGAGKLSKLVIEKLPTKLYSSATKLESSSASKLLNDKQWGTLGKIKGYADAEGERLNDLIKENISKNNGTISSKDFLKNTITRIKEKYQGVSADKIKSALKNADIDPFLKQKEVDFLTADNIRKNLYGTTSFKDTTKFGQGVKDILWQEIVNTYRKPTGTDKLFEQYAPLVRASKSLNKTLTNQSKKMGISLSDLLVGLGTGFGYSNPVTGIGTVAVKKAIESPLVKTGTAVGLNEINKIIDKIPVKYFDASGKISRTALINALKEIQ